MCDYIRAPYRTHAHLYPDDPLPYEIEWRVADDNAPLLGFPCAINNLMFARDHDDWLPTAVGEIFCAPRPFTRWRAFPLATGNHVCGTAEDFAGLGTFRPDLPPVEYRADGLPRCCGGGFQGIGGGVGGGTATVTSHAVYTGSGGGVGGGTATVYGRPLLVGGGVGGGTATVTSHAVVVGEGGGVGGGTADVSGYAIGTGGGVGGGAATVTSTSEVTGTGGGVGGGAATVTSTSEVTGTGGGVGGGTADVAGFIPGTGGGVGGGTADVSHGFAGTGGGVGGGTAGVTSHTVVVGTGGGVGGGTADVSSTDGYCDQYLVDGVLATRDVVFPLYWHDAGYTVGLWAMPSVTEWQAQTGSGANIFFGGTTWDGTGTHTFDHDPPPGTILVSCADEPPP